MLKSMSDTRQHAHELIDRMPEAALSLGRIAGNHRDARHSKTRKSVTRKSSAVAESIEWLKHNKPIPHEEVLAEFGLTMEDFERMGGTPLPSEKNGTDR